MQKMLTKIKFLMFMWLALSLSACMVGPDFHSPTAPAVARYTAKPLPLKTVSVKTKNHSGESQYFINAGTVPSDWWSLFHSNTLNQLITVALSNNPTLASAKATLTETQENLNAQIGVSYYPAFNAQFSAEREKFSNSTFGGSSPASIFNLYNASVNVSYTLDFFGGERRGVEALRAQVDNAQEEWAAALITLTANVVTTAITSASLNAQIDATQQIIQSLQAQLEIVRHQYRLGGASWADVLSQQSQLETTKATLPPLIQSFNQSQHALAVLVGQFPGEKEMPVIQLTELRLPTQLPVTLPSTLVRQRPDIRAAEALLHVASANVGVATANLFPQVTINGSYGWTKTVLANLINPNNNIWNVGASVLQPIFYGGELRAKRRAAIAGYEFAMQQYRLTVLTAFQNVADTLRALENDAKTLKAQSASEAAARDSLAITLKQYRVGGVSYLALLNAQKQYQQARISLVQAEAARFNDTAALFQALGGGWS